MTLDGATILYLAIAAVAIGGALTVAFTRNVTRMAIGLGAFFLAVACFFAMHALPFLAVAQIFLYVGGVLVLFIFAVMLVHRSAEGVPDLESRHDIGSLSVAIGVFVLVVFSLSGVASGLTGTPQLAEATAGSVLLSELLPQFEAAGVLLLIALIAVLVIARSDRE